MTNAMLVYMNRFASLHLTKVFFVNRLTKKILVLAALTTVTGCTKVGPWEKGNFTKATMAVQPWSMPAYLDKKTAEKALESSKGGTSLGGGGCGCG